MNPVIVVKGGGDLASGIVHRLWQCGFAVVITEIDNPTVVRRTVAFAQAVFTGKATVEGITAKKVEWGHEQAALASGVVPVLVDPGACCVRRLRPFAVVDAIVAKHNTGTTLCDAPVVIGVGPGFTAGMDVAAVVETMRGHDLGRVYYEGAAKADTGIPGEIAGYTLERLLRAPAGGIFQGCCEIGDVVEKGAVVGYVAGQPVRTSIDGVLRGLIQAGTPVAAGLKIGDIDPRCSKDHCYTISDKARAIAGGVLEALLHLGKKTDALPQLWISSKRIRGNNL